MNDNSELQKRLQAADPASAAPDLNATVVARAATGKTKPLFGFKQARFLAGAGAAGASALALSLVLPQFLAPAPLFTVADANSGSSKTSATSESSLGVADDMMYWPGWSIYEYSAGPDLSNQTGTGTVYQGRLIGDPIDLLSAMAKVFGLSGEPVRDEWSDDQYPSYSIIDGNANMNTYWSGTGSWSYSSWSEANYVCTDQDTRDESNAEASYCEPTLTPELIPTVDQLRATTVELLRLTGQEFEPSSFEVYRDDWGAYVSLPYLSNGIDTGAWTYLSWGMNGELSYFSSHSFELVDRGQFDTISALNAVARISDGRWFGGPPDSFYRTLDDSGVVEARSEGIASSEEQPTVSEPEPISEDGTAADTSMPADQDPSENYEPEIVQLTVTSSDTMMLTVWDSQGNYWLVPGYILYNDQGWFDSIISLEDGVIELPEPIQIMPMDGIREIDEPPLMVD